MKPGMKLNEYMADRHAIPSRSARLIVVFPERNVRQLLYKQCFVYSCLSLVYICT